MRVSRVAGNDRLGPNGYRAVSRRGGCIRFRMAHVDVERVAKRGRRRFSVALRAAILWWSFLFPGGTMHAATSMTFSKAKVGNKEIP